MKKIDNFNNMKKTVLKLENEINAISLNLTKVQKKEHSKMKNIIHNINKLLIKESDKNKIHSNKVDKYLCDIKGKNKNDKNINSNKYVHSKKNDIDCILISLKNQKNKNNNELNLNDETFFNKNRKASSKICINNNNQHHLTSDEKILNINLSEYENYKANTLTSKLNIKNMNKSRNTNNLFYNHMTYSKPKLNNEFSKNNINKKREKAKSSEKVKNNIFDINNKVDTLIEINGKSESISISKYSKSNRKSKSKQIKEKKNIENLNYCNNDFSNLKKNYEKKPFKKEMLYNKNIFENNDKKTEENSNDNGGYFQIPETNFNLIKNKKEIFELKSEDKKICNTSKNLKNLLLLNKKKYTNTYRNNENFINKNHTGIAYLNKEEKNKNIFISYEEMDKKMNDEDLILKTINVQKNKIMNMNKRNYSKENKKDTDIEENNIKLTKLLNLLNANDINEAISRIAKLIKLEKSILKLKQIYFESNNNHLNNPKNNEEKNTNLDWLNEMIKNYKENKIYKNFCQTIMVDNKLNHFDDFKNFINNILINNKKSNGFLVEVKNILLEDDYYAKQKKGNSFNRKNYENNSKNINKTNNKTFYDLENSNDIKFSNNDDNFDKKEDWTKTYY